MYVKRNIKMNPQVRKSIEKTKPIINQTSSKLKRNGYGKYKFPIYDEIPSANYFSKVTDIRNTTTKAGKEAIEVFYKIKDGITCYKIANGILPEDTKNESYYIKQVYPKDSQYYEDFVNAMCEALDVDECDYEDIIGVTEYISIYYDKSDIGGIKERIPYVWEDFIKPKDDDEMIDDEYNEYDY